MLFQPDQLQHLNRQIEALNAIAQIVAVSADLDGLLEDALDRLVRVLEFDGAALFLLDTGSKKLELHVSVGFSSHYSKNMSSISVGNQFPGRAVRDGKVRFIEDIKEDSRVRASLKNREGMQSYACVPLAGTHGVTGVLEVASKTPKRLNEIDLQFLTAVAAQTSTAVENVRLQERADVLAIEEERTWLAREVHDTIVQGLVALSIELELAGTALEDVPNIESAAESINRGLRITRSTLDEARASIAYLRGQVLDRPSLPDAIANLAKMVEERTDIDVSLHFSKRLRRFPLNIEEALVRVATESLNNVWKHSQAKKVTISLNLRRGDLNLTIEDDGIGFDPSKNLPMGHYGLVGMRERLIRVGGSLRIESKPGQGTRITAAVPASGRSNEDNEFN